MELSFAYYEYFCPTDGVLVQSCVVTVRLVRKRRTLNNHSLNRLSTPSFANLALYDNRHTAINAIGPCYSGSFQSWYWNNVCSGLLYGVIRCESQIQLLEVHLLSQFALCCLQWFRLVRCITGDGWMALA